MRPAFSYYGNKVRAASKIWHRLGDPSYYYEPFGGSLATLLNRPEPTSGRGRYEFVSDVDCMITNFVRAVKYGDPAELAEITDYPSSQIDLKARLIWLKNQKLRLKRGLHNDPEWFDPKAAGWYAWCFSVKVASTGTTILYGRRGGVLRSNQDLTEYFTEMKTRLAKVSLCYTDWSHLANAASKLSKLNDTAILLDPPYKYDTGRTANLYAHDNGTIADYVKEWALAVSSIRPRLKIALCGFVGEHRMPADWEEVAWKSQCGKGRERIWFSPNCADASKDEPNPAQSVEPIAPIGDRAIRYSGE